MIKELQAAVTAGRPDPPIPSITHHAVLGVGTAGGGLGQRSPLLGVAENQ